MTYHILLSSSFGCTKNLSNSIAIKSPSSSAASGENNVYIAWADANTKGNQADIFFRASPPPPP
ncbi:MAG TPA: hypothetical protein VKA95_15845 [Nitrososphaeraceae archaeon]|nr:hypothetical protein [Nitrososphaeraceae archaeon]